jgi:hypothetical protein
MIHYDKLFHVQCANECKCIFERKLPEQRTVIYVQTVPATLR